MFPGWKSMLIVFVGETSGVGARRAPQPDVSPTKTINMLFQPGNNSPLGTNYSVNQYLYMIIPSRYVPAKIQTLKYDFIHEFPIQVR